MKHDDYYLVKRFKILRVEINGKIYDRLIKPGNRQLKYITFEGTVYIRTFRQQVKKCKTVLVFYYSL